MNTRTVTYRIATAITAFVMATGGLAYVLGAQWAVSGVLALGYPRYVVTLLGVWKLLGVLAILWPGFPRLKEWAYAGIAFDLSGAAVSHLAVGDPFWHLPLTLGLLAVAFVSWAFRPAGRVLPPLAPAGPAVASGEASPEQPAVAAG
jgi:hypothetical protein